MLAVSRDDGKSLNKRGVSFVNGGLREFQKNVYLLEDDTSESYCYTSMISTNDGCLVSYYHSAGTPHCLRASKIVKITWDETD